MTDIAKTEWTDWIAHKPGDPCPIPRKHPVNFVVRYRSGNEELLNCAPSNLWWGKFVGDIFGIEIIAYRTLKEPSP